MKKIILISLMIFSFIANAYDPDGTNKAYVDSRLMQIQASNFLQRTVPDTSNYYSVSYGNSTYCAVGIASGPAGAVMSSPQGATWTARTPGTNLGSVGIAYGASLFVAVGTGSGASQDVMTSPDCVTWTNRTAASHVQWHSVNFNGTIFVAVGGSNSIMYSSNGTSWTSSTPPAGTTGTDWRSVTYGGGVFVAVGAPNGANSDNRVATSSDGITWTARVAGADRTWKSVVYGGSQFVAVSANTSGTSSAMTSSNGITWTLRTPYSTAASYNSVAYNGKAYVAVGDNASMYSIDGITWINGGINYVLNWSSILWANNQFVMVSSSGSVLGAATSPTFLP